MYGIFTYIYHKNQPNVGKYTSPMNPMGMTGNLVTNIFQPQIGLRSSPTVPNRQVLPPSRFPGKAELRWKAQEKDMDLPSLKLTVRTRKWWFPIGISFSRGLFSDMLVF